MITKTIKTIADIKIPKGTVIPGLYANDMPLGYAISVPSGIELMRRISNNGYYSYTQDYSTTEKNIVFIPMPYVPPICYLAKSN